jgi:hypothetical protein
MVFQNRKIKVVSLALAYACIFAFTSGCSLKGGLKRLKGRVDFEKTEIIASDIGIADGSDELVVAIQLKNSDNSVVEEYKPQYQVVSGSVAYQGPCTKSSNLGISVCILKAIQPGTKKLRLLNAKVGLEKEVLFALRGTQSTTSLVAASGVQIPTSGGYKANLSVGPWVNSKAVQTPNGYKVYLSVQSSMDSRHAN